MREAARLQWMSCANHWVLHQTSACVHSQLQCHCSYASGTYSWETSLFCRLQRYCTGAVQCLFIINKLCETLLWKKVQQCMHGSVTVGPQWLPVFQKIWQQTFLLFPLQLTSLESLLILLSSNQTLVVEMLKKNIKNTLRFLQSVMVLCLKEGE